MNIVEYIGRNVIAFFYYSSTVYSFLIKTFSNFIIARSYFSQRLIISSLYRQIIFTGMDALPVISVIALLVGAVVIIQAFTQLTYIGGEELAGKILSLTIYRELGPLITAAIIAGRSGCAVAIELGNMKINNEIDALEIMGVDVRQFIIAPRVIGFIFSSLALLVYFDLIATLGGYFISITVIKVSFFDFIKIAVESLTPFDVIIFFLKIIIFSSLIAAVACYHGLSVYRSFTEVPQQTTKAMINSMLICFSLNFIITAIAYW